MSASKPNRKQRLALIAASLVMVCVIPLNGCYRKVVNSRGIGADSTKLRGEHESRPTSIITTESRVESRESTPARKRETP